MKRREPRAYGVRCFPFSDVLSFLLDRKRKRFLAFARNNGMGKRCGDTTLPPSYGRRCPEGAEVGSRSGIKRNGEGAFSHITFPSTAEGAFFVYRSLFPSRMKRREPRAYGVPCFPFSDALPFLLDRKRKRFLACARNDGMGKRYSRIASFLTRKGFVCRHWPKQVILLLIRNKKRALPSGDALFDLLCLSKVLVSNAQDRSFGQVPPNLYSHTSSASSRIRARLFSQPRQGSVMDLP